MPPRRLPARRRPTTAPARKRVALISGMGRALGGLVARRRITYNPTPTFVETFSAPQINIPVGPVGGGGRFSVNIGQIPQFADYFNLYRQYRINWVKVLLVPESSGASTDLNQAAANQVAGLPFIGMTRIAYVINDSPALPAPVNEADVLTDNGAKVRAIKTMFSVSFRPRPNKFTGDAGGGAGVAVRERNQSWLTFTPIAQNANPEHFGVSYWMTCGGGNGAVANFNVYYKVSFSLRDPQ